MSWILEKARAVLDLERFEYGELDFSSMSELAKRAFISVPQSEIRCGGATDATTYDRHRAHVASEKLLDGWVL